MKKQLWTLQSKSIDFYGTTEMDEGLWAPNVDTDELHSQVDFHNTWQDHDSRFTTFNPLQEKGNWASWGKILRSKWRYKSDSETVLIMETG